ncbi:MAG: hypothetical protein RIR26_811 [Pseudomonadota bacterium]
MAGNRTLTIFLPALVAITAGVVLFKQFRQTNTKEEIRPLVDTTVFGSVDRIALEHNSKKVVLKKNEQNEWAIESDQGFSADAKKISQFLDGLNASKIERTVVKKAEKVEEYGLGAAAPKIALESKGKSLLALELGESRSGGGQFIKFSDKDSVFLATAAVSTDLDVDHWAYKTLLKIPKKEIQTITWQEGKNLTKSVTYSRKAEADKFELSPAKSDLKEEKFTQLMDSLENLSFEKRKERADQAIASALAAPSRRVTLNLFDGRKVTLTSAVPPSEKGGLIPMDVSVESDPKSGKTIPTKLAEEMTRISDVNKKYFFLFPARVASGN